MKNVAYVLAVLLATILDVHSADRSSNDPIEAALTSPEIILHFGKQIGLSDEQREFITAEAKMAQESVKEPREQLENEKRKFARLLQKTITGEEETVEILERLLKYDSAVKLIHYRALVRIKNNLSATQRSKLAELKKGFDPKKAGPTADFQKRLQAKIEKIKKGMQELADIGVSPEAVAKMVQGLQPLLNLGKYREAEALLDQAIKKLDDPF